MTIALNAQKKKGKTPCPDPVEANYTKVMSSTFVKEYTDCPVIIEAEFFKGDFPKNLVKPSKFRKMYVFQCVGIGNEGQVMPLSNEVVGDFFVISKDQADAVLNLKRGDKVKFTGVTVAHSSLAGAFQVTPYFIVEKMEVMNNATNSTE